MLEGFSVTGLFKKLAERNLDATNVFIDGEAAGTAKVDFKSQTILASERFIKSEFNGEIPSGVRTSFSVKGCFSPFIIDRVAGD